MKKQTVSCETKFAHVRAHSHMCDVHAKSILECACDVRSCGTFQDVRSHICKFLHTFCDISKTFGQSYTITSISSHCARLDSFMNQWMLFPFMNPWLLCPIINNRSNSNMPCSSMYPTFIPIYVKKKLSFTLGKGACDVRAAENRVCECSCVRGKKSLQLTV